MERRQAEQQNALVQASRPVLGVLQLNLNRPDKLNALSKALLAQLHALLDQARADDNVGCVVITGNGRAFAAGADIADMLERGVASYADPDRLAVWAAIESFPKRVQDGAIRHA